VSYDNWKTTPPEMDQPDCPVCGLEMDWIGDGASILWVCPDAGCPGSKGDLHSDWGEPEPHLPKDG